MKFVRRRSLYVDPSFRVVLLGRLRSRFPYGAAVPSRAARCLMYIVVPKMEQNN